MAEEKVSASFFLVDENLVPFQMNLKFPLHLISFVRRKNVISLLLSIHLNDKWVFLWN